MPKYNNNKNEVVNRNINECFRLKQIKRLNVKQKLKYFNKQNRDNHFEFGPALMLDNAVILPKKNPNLDNTINNVLSNSDYKKMKENMRYLRFEKSSIHNWGVFSTKAFKEGEAIVEYTGEIIRYGVTQVREKYYEEHGNNGTYIFRLDDDKYLDATKRGGIAKYLNHSCDPNCSTQIINSCGERHVIIYAKRNIDEYEELCYDYELPFESKENAIVCLCGSQNCRGYLNYPREGTKEEEEFIRKSQEIDVCNKTEEFE